MVTFARHILVVQLVVCYVYAHVFTDVLTHACFELYQTSHTLLDDLHELSVGPQLVPRTVNVNIHKHTYIEHCANHCMQM